MIASLDLGVLDEPRAIIGDDDRVLDNVSSRVVRTRVPAPFPVHRWGEHVPHVAVLPKTARGVGGRKASPTAPASPSSRVRAAPGCPTAPCRCAAVAASWSTSSS